MIKVILSGCGGAMGWTVSSRARSVGCEIVAGIDIKVSSKQVRASSYPVFGSAGECTAKGDVIIDFSHPSALEGLLELARKTSTPLVLATTGLDETQLAQVRAAAEHTPIFFSFNMSLGINLMSALARMATKVLGGQFDIEIIEKHHRRKLDAPSGTAIMLAQTVSSELNSPPEYVHERYSKRSPRGQNEIGMHAVRGGTIVGEHELLFAGQDETLSITHTAYSREVFATGALSAAKFMAGNAPGLYDMNDLINNT